MNTDGHGWDHAAAERLLDGVRGDPGAVPQPLADLLTAASARGTEAELAGEEAAVAAFHAAALSPGAESLQGESPQKAARAWFPLVRLLPLKIAAMTLVTATAAGGLALAAHFDRLPLGPLSPAPTPEASPRSPHASARPNAVPGQEEGPSASPSRAVLLGQCQTYTAVEPGQRANELSKPALRGLVRAAGGTSNVPSYCARLMPPQQPTEGATPETSDNATKPPVVKRPPDSQNGRNGQRPDKGKPQTPNSPKPGNGGGGAPDDAVPDDKGGPPSGGMAPDEGHGMSGPEQRTTP
ncbi:hypothetical protein [Actinomadura sp. 9N407]|uniref:hypothetical protein n=1 Tax=Actinomadura sp. 9N407 TaxID=3375154 RepID=UPI0037884A5D